MTTSLTPKLYHFILQQPNDHRITTPPTPKLKYLIPQQPYDHWMTLLQLPY